MPKVNHTWFSEVCVSLTLGILQDKSLVFVVVVVVVLVGDAAVVVGATGKEV